MGNPGVTGGMGGMGGMGGTEHTGVVDGSMSTTRWCPVT